MEARLAWSDVNLKNIEPREVPAAADGARRLLNASAVRATADRMLHLALAGSLPDWNVDLERLAPTADFVADVVRERYPRLEVPVHSRWRHFVFGGRNLWTEIRAVGRWKTRHAAARAAFDLAITSVLLDAGAGAGWRYSDRATGLSATRSEGLALASLRWFADGGASDDRADPCRADAAALRRIDVGAVESAFQVQDGNPLVGLQGRAALLNRLGAVVASRPELFAAADSPRPGGLYDLLRARAVDGELQAGRILETLLDALGPIWEDRPTLAGVPLGDCWPHPALAGKRPEDGYVPLHKLSQWLAYSLIEPLEDAGIAVTDVRELTGLAEYRNGGLLVDMGVLRPRNPGSTTITHRVPDPFVVGWRALTVALLDRLAPLVGDRLGLGAERFPLASMLEGGTWAAGRILARELRPDGGPPFNILSDGTVF